MVDLNILVDELAELIADKVAAKIGGNVPANETKPKAKAKKGVPEEADPPDVVDEPSEAETEEPAKKRTRKSRKSKEPEPEPEAVDEDEDIDLPTPEQLKEVAESCAEYSVEDASSELIDYYVAQGSSKKEAAESVSAASDEEIKEAFLDSSARLLALQDDGSYNFVEGYDDIYKAERVVKGDVVTVWIRYGEMLTPEEIKEAKLEPVDAPKKKRRTRKSK